MGKMIVLLPAFASGLLGRAISKPNLRTHSHHELRHDPQEPMNKSEYQNVLASFRV